MATMKVGEQRTFSVCAHTVWSETGIELQAGATYRFSARGTWWDFYVRTDPDGYAGLPFQKSAAKRLRMPGTKWFALCGALGRDEQSAFLIGTSTFYTAPADGPLYCFANDLRGWYWNNVGSITVTVSRDS